jgi:hypothetical protein
LIRNVTLVDSAAGGCQNVQVGPDGFCFLVAHAEYNAETGRLYIDFQAHRNNVYHKDGYIVVLDASSHKAISRIFYDVENVVATRQLWAVFDTPTEGTVMFTSKGAAAATSNDGYIDKEDLEVFNSMASESTIIDASKIPGSPPRYLMLLLKAKGGTYKMVTYDAFTDTVVSSNDNTAAATTHYMLAYTWGVCNGNVTRSLVELSFSNDYSNECQLPSTGLYYQSENRYFAIPYSCLGIAYERLLTDCPEVKANMKSLVDSTCAASIPKVCQQQYETNPPFSCVADIFSSPLTVLSLAASNTIALYGVFSFLAGFFIRRVYAQYKASIEEMKELNPREELGVLVCSLIASICGFSAFDVVDEDEDDGKGSSGKTVAASVEMVGCYKCDTEKADADSASSSWSDIDSIFSPN